MRLECRSRIVRWKTVSAGLALAALTAAALLAQPGPAPFGRRSAAACAPTSAALCLSSARFRVEVLWRDFQGATGAGQAVPLTGDTGYFWFFNSANVELVVKVLDARALNGNFWVFYGALSNVAYTISVTDSVTGNVKTYVNPSGHFGSVGDTQAFPAAAAATTTQASAKDIEGWTASGALALRESSIPAGAPAAAAGTCLATNTSLCLNGGRFRVEVVWTDFAGKTGVGTAVGLTGDTGYFWFFSSSNVELTVKALDARALNGRFWVFYGALSNVEYRMNVTDTLTGIVNTYSNPSGRFASAGDTDGFRTGYGVAAQLDPSRMASSVMPTTGGTLSVTGADGTLFTLTVPDGALLSKEEISMTPVAAVDRLPLSGGLVAAVQLSPEGLRLFKPATLVINPPAPIPVDQEITFAWRGTGDEFTLYPPDPLATPAISLSLMHFSAYGAGRATGSDQAAQQARPPANRHDQLLQDLQGPAAEQRKALRGGGTSSTAKAVKVLTDYLNDVLIPSEPSTCSADWKGYFVHLGSFRKQVLLLTGPDPGLLDAARSSYDRVLALIEGCYDGAYDRCKSQNDATQGEEMLRIYGVLKSELANDRVDRGKMARCLTFELSFNSFIQEPFEYAPTLTFQFRHQVAAILPTIVFSPFPDDPRVLPPAELKYVTADYTGDTGDSKCTLATSGSSSVFRVLSMNLDVNLFEGNGEPPEDLTVDYDPGFPDFTFTLTCPGPGPVTITQPRWRSIYEAHRQAGSGSTFTAADWTKPGTGLLYALKTYSQDDIVGRETTSLQLRHTPQ